MVASANICNGFRLRGLNSDAGVVAVQSTHETTWLLTRKKWAGMLPKWHEVGLAQTEIKVLRPYGGAPVLEIESLGGPYGVLIVERARGGTRVLRNGTRLRLELQPDESVILKTEHWRSPRTEGTPTAAA